jgi:hypothetical protein
MAEVIVTLTVDTSQLQCKILIFCDFGQGLGISNEDFNSGQCGDTITWGF